MSDKAATSANGDGAAPGEGDGDEEQPPLEELVLPDIETHLTFEKFADMVRTLMSPMDINQETMKEFFAEFDPDAKGYVNFEVRKGTIHLLRHA